MSPVTWLSGVRRTGKTTLAESFPESLFMNCDLPSTRAALSDPESFYKKASHDLIVFDEIHRLENPSEVLKIGADLHSSKIRFLATATSRFNDSRTGRKRSVHLIPLLPGGCESFGIKNIQDWMVRGGLPPALLSESYDPGFYSEWIDSFFARDVQELFKVEKRRPFLELFEMLLRQNGGIAEGTQFAKLTGLSRPTIIRYLEALETTQAISIIRPFHQGGRQELTARPKIYGFDTGMVAYAKRWDRLRSEDCGHLLENLTLESLQAVAPLRGIFYWRTKQQKKIDFVIPVNRKTVHLVECKWKGKELDPSSIRKFREDYPEGENILVCSDAHLINEKHFKMDQIQPASIETFRQKFQELLEKNH